MANESSSQGSASQDTTNVPDEDTSFMYLTRKTATRSLTVCCTTMQRRLDVSFADVRQRRHLADYPGSTSILLEMSEVNMKLR